MLMEWENSESTHLTPTKRGSRKKMKKSGLQPEPVYIPPRRFEDDSPGLPGSSQLWIFHLRILFHEAETAVFVNNNLFS